jgi:hypothetical protein
MEQQPTGLVRIKARVRQSAAALDQQDGLPLRNQLLIFIGAALTVISRCPSLFYRAQFFAEDVVNWYSQAYTGGWLHSFWIPDAGYLQFIQRVGAGAALLVPFRWAPLLIAVFGLLLQCLPVPMLLSARCRNWGPLSFRVLLVAIYLAIPNAREVNVNLTNSQWHLGLFTVFLVFALPARTLQGRIAEVLYLLFAGFCGPFGLLLIPFIVAIWLFRRRNWSLAVIASLSVGGTVQFLELLHPAARVQGYLGAGLIPLLHILGADVITGSLLGGYPFSWYIPTMPLVLAGLLGIAVYFYCLRFAELEFKLFVLFSFLLLAGALQRPMIVGPKPLWELLVSTPSNRYWFFPSLAFLWGAAWCLYFAPHRLFRNACKWLLLVMIVGVLDDWEYRPYPNEHFPQSAERFRIAPPGTHVVIPITPKGWTVDLIKKQPAGQY